MKVSELWLRSFINPPQSIAALADQLTNAGIEVDALERTEDKTKQSMTLKIPPNRGDCLSMQGIAREIALLNDTPYSPIEIPTLTSKIKDTLPIQVDAPEVCPRYLGCIVKNVTVTTATPNWIRERLELAGIKTNSIIVDILNYVMLELGQPLHAFDLAKLKGGVVVRKAKKGERITLLDGVEKTLEVETVVIADKSTPHAIAGVMGGLDSAVSNATTDVFLESAYFDPIAIRFSEERYGLRTDAAHRFERGVDSELQEPALKRAIQLILENAGGVAGPIVEKKNERTLPKSVVIELRKKRIQDILGFCPSDATIVGIFTRSHMKVETQLDSFKVFVPSHRQDLTLEVDLIEEIARVFGYSNIAPLPITTTLNYSRMSEEKISSKRLKKVLTDRGYCEAITYSFTDPTLMDLFQFKEKPYCLSNPISPEMSAMRVSLWPGLLQAVQYNHRRQQNRSRLFEMGNCFLREGNTGSTVVEQMMLGGVCAGSVYPEQWGVPARKLDFYDIKKDIEALFTIMGAEKKVLFKKALHPALHPLQSAEIIYAEKTVGYLGALHPRILKALELEDPVFVFELKLAELQAVIPAFQSVSKFPVIRRDIAIKVNVEVFIQDLRAAIVNSVGPLLKEVLVFDVYQGKGIESGKKSVALGLILQHPSRTLVEGEVNDIVAEVLNVLSKQFQATLRM